MQGRTRVHCSCSNTEEVSISPLDFIGLVVEIICENTCPWTEDASLARQKTNNAPKNGPVQRFVPQAFH